MRNLSNAILIIGLSFIFGACPYESAVPIDTPQVKINMLLLGKWMDPNDENEHYQVNSLDSLTYEIVKYKKDTKEEVKYKAYLSTINENSFLNLWENKPNITSPMFILYKIEKLDSNSLLIAEITENITETFHTIIELKNFIAENMNHSFFYGKEKINLIR